MEATAGLYFQKIIGPRFFNQETNVERVAQLTSELIPAQLEYLESQVGDGWLVGTSLSIADISVGASLVNLLHVEFDIESSCWPKTHAYFERLKAQPFFAQQLAAERAMFAKA